MEKVKFGDRSPRMDARFQSCRTRAQQGCKLSESLSCDLDIAPA